MSENRAYTKEMANFGDYPGDFILLSGDREIRSKIWSTLPDYPGESTALRLYVCCWSVPHLTHSLQRPIDQVIVSLL